MVLVPFERVKCRLYFDDSTRVVRKIFFITFLVNSGRNIVTDLQNSRPFMTRNFLRSLPY